MTNRKIHEPAVQGDEDRPKKVAEHLSPVAHDLIALAVNGKQAHWHLRGANFIGVHEFLDEVVAHAQAASDTVAERIVALGQPVDGRIGTVAAKTSTPEMDFGFQNPNHTVKEVVAQIDATLETVYTAVRELDDVDLPSQDIVIAIAQQLDKDRWFLTSHFAE